jgi:hypothetical protein
MQWWIENPRQVVNLAESGSFAHAYEESLRRGQEVTARRADSF